MCILNFDPKVNDGILQNHAARVGGDEFVIFLNGIATKEAAADCRPGVSMVPEDGMDYKTLVKHADRRVYRAKSGGKNQFVL